MLRTKYGTLLERLWLIKASKISGIHTLSLIQFPTNQQNVLISCLRGESPETGCISTNDFVLLRHSVTQISATELLIIMIGSSWGVYLDILVSKQNRRCYRGFGDRSSSHDMFCNMRRAGPRSYKCLNQPWPNTTKQT